MAELNDNTQRKIEALNEILSLEYAGFHQSFRHCGMAKVMPFPVGKSFNRCPRGLFRP